MSKEAFLQVIKIVDETYDTPAFQEEVKQFIRLSGCIPQAHLEMKFTI
jgi:hypothetical protein